MGRAMVVIEYASEEDSKAAANQAHSLISHAVDDLHAVLRRMESLRALHPSCFQDEGITQAHEALVQDTMGLHSAIGRSWTKAIR